MEHWLKFMLILELLTAFLSLSYCIKMDDNPVIGEFKCSEGGIFPHPDTKHKFYECVKLALNPNGFVSLTHTCEDAKCYDKNHSHKCSLSACGIGLGESTLYPCLRAQMKADSLKLCENETLSVLELARDKLVEFVATRGDPFRNLVLSLRDINVDMKTQYAKMIEATGKNIYPLMIATDGEPDYIGVGGTYKVYFRDGSLKRITPVRPNYEIFKSLGHVVRGVYAIVSPYFHSPNSINWEPQLRKFQGSLNDIDYLLKNEKLELSKKELAVALNLIKETNVYIDKAIKDNSADIKTYTKYAHELADDVEDTMNLAAKYQAEDTLPALIQLKEEMGEEEWRKMFVVIPNVWPVAMYNVRLQALGKVMSFDQLKSQVLMVEGALSEDAAKTTLGRVIFDRAAAQLIWGGMEEKMPRDHIFSLSTRRDLVSTAAGIELDKVCVNLEVKNEATCPHAGVKKSKKMGMGYSGMDSSAEDELPELMLATMLS